MPRPPRRPARLRDILRVRVPRRELPEPLGARWWLLAPAISAVLLLLAPYIWFRSQIVTLDDVRAQQAGSRAGEAPMLLWATEGADGRVVAESPGGDPLPGGWSLAGERYRGDVLRGAWPLRDPDSSVRWAGWLAESREIDGVEWRRFVRRAVAADVDRLGQDPALAGRWWVWSRDDAWVDLRGDGRMVDPDGRDVGRWAGSGDVIVTYEDEAWRSMWFVVYVRGGYPLDDPDLEGWSGFGHAEACEQRVLVRRDAPEEQGRQQE